MSPRKKKMIVPIVITVLFLIYLLIYAVVIAGTVEFTPLLILPAIPLSVLGTAMIMVLRDRIREIKGGEEDDLSNY